MRVTYLLLMILMFGCSRQLTRQDVEAQISDARAKVLKAQESVSSAIEKREQFYEDYKESKLKELEKRNDTLEDKIKNLENTAGGTNTSAQSNIESAIGDFKLEQEQIKDKISRVEQIEAEDWSEAYDELNEAISDIKRQLDRLAFSLDQSEIN